MTVLRRGDVCAQRFAIDRELGTGAMGAVYRAWDRLQERWIALKILHNEESQGRAAQRFAREAQLLSELRHPGIVSYVSHGQTLSGQHFLAMEWLEGEDLAQRLVRGPLRLGDALLLVRCVAETLAWAHQQGVIHRDLKPSNLFLVGGQFARVKILDFGIARRIATARAVTKTGTVLGTPDYMAPEQARGSRDLTAAVDLFSLGCVLYECLTGQPPYVADHIAAVLVRILLEEPVALAQRRLGIPDSVVAIVDRLLIKDPARRLADAAVLRDELLALGTIADPGLNGTQPDARSPCPMVFADSEQRLLSVVLAAPREDGPELADVLRGHDFLLEHEQQALVRALQALSVSPNFLATGALVVMAPLLGSAHDQVALAARAALLIKSRWPAAMVSLATGRGTVDGHMAFGEVVEQAARLRQSGSPQADRSAATGVFVDALSAKLLAGRFTQIPRLGGALLVAEEKDMDASRPLLGKPTPCVGRESELAILESQLQNCIEEAEARVALVTALPGIGKSRLRHEFLRRVAQRTEAVTILLGRGDFMSAGAPYGILSRAVCQLCELVAGESIQAQQARISARVERLFAIPEKPRTVEFLGELCGVAFVDEGTGRLRAARADPRIMHDQIRRAFLEWLAAECSAAPVLIVLDDLQWGDALSLNLLDAALRELRCAPFMVLALARPEFRESFPRLWFGHRLQEVTLKGLGRRACERLVRQVLDKQLAPELLSRIVDQSAGNALFLEELIRSAAEGNLEREPKTVVAMLQARIARIEPGPRKVIRAASVFGETFWRAGVADLLGTDADEGTLDGWLSGLVDAEMIELHATSRLAQQKEYSFRHALVRVAAYELLTASELVSGHRAAGWFLTQAGELDIMIIAEHAERGGEHQRAITCFSLAAEQALVRYDLDGAMTRIDRAMRLGPVGPELGKLYAIQSSALLWRSQLLESFSVGQQALALLPPGDNWWCNTINHLAITAANLVEPGPLEELADRLAALDPKQAAPVPYTHAVAMYLMELGLVCDRRRTNIFLKAVQHSCELLPAEQLTTRAYVDFCRAWQILCSEPIPWQMLCGAQRSTAFFRAAEDNPNFLIGAVVRGLAEIELGARERGKTTLREVIALVEQLQVPFISSVSKSYLVFFFALDDPEAETAEALQIIAEGKVAPIGVVRGFTLMAHALYTLGRGDAVAAEAAARAAVNEFPLFIPFRLLGIMVILQCLQAQCRHTEALELAEEGLSRLAQLGGAGFAEVPLRTVAAATFYSAGDNKRGRAELLLALAQIELRASGIPEPSWQTSYLTHNPFCVRACTLAAQWQLPVPPLLSRTTAIT